MITDSLTGDFVVLALAVVVIGGILLIWNGPTSLTRRVRLFLGSLVTLAGIYLIVIAVTTYLALASGQI